MNVFSFTHPAAMQGNEFVKYFLKIKPDNANVTVEEDPHVQLKQSSKHSNENNATATIPAKSSAAAKRSRSMRKNGGASEYEQGVAIIRDWFASLLAQEFPKNIVEFEEQLRDGVVLCRAINALMPGAIPNAAPTNPLRNIST